MFTSPLVCPVFSTVAASPQDRLEPMGRALMLRAIGPLDEGSLLCRTAPLDIARRGQQEHSRVVVLDAFPCAYADSDGLRWILSLKSALADSELPLHIVARTHSRVRRNIELLHADLSLYDTVQDALHPHR